MPCLDLTLPQHIWYGYAVTNAGPVFTGAIVPIGLCKRSAFAMLADYPERGIEPSTRDGAGGPGRQLTLPALALAFGQARVEWRLNCRTVWMRRAW